MNITLEENTRRWPLKGLPLRNAESRANAKLALNPDRPSAFVVTSDEPGLGKTTFVRECLSRLFPHPCPSICSTEHEIRSACNMAAERGYLWLDDVRASALESSTLLCFMTSQRWTFRRYGQSAPVSVENNCVVFITGNQLPLSSDLLRRVRVIELKARKEAA